MKPQPVLIAFFFFFFFSFSNSFFSCVVGNYKGGCCGMLFAQGETNFWYFGNSGLDFSGGTPIALSNGQLSTVEGCASISNSAGNLLFYTDGIYVLNRNHVQMPNGFGLMGHSSSSQSAIIIQKPGSATIYYIFTSDAEGGANGIRFSEVDVSLFGGLGDVTSKNIFLNASSCEKIAAVRHCNGQDVWIVTHDWPSDVFRTYLVTSVGVNTIPVLSTVGLSLMAHSLSTTGYLKASPNGKKLALATSSYLTNGMNRFELFDFNSSTGIVSNALLFPQFAAFEGAYGVEFSPDGTKMYGTTINPGNIYQFDLCAGSNTAIANSGILIGSSSPRLAALQVGLDQKIYVARHGVPWLGVINSPNALGSGCNYVDNGVSLSGNCTLGLPYFSSWYYKQVPPSPFTTVQGSCFLVTFTAPTVNVNNCSGSANVVTSVSWNFGDPASGGNNTSTLTNPIHTFSGGGTYTVTMVLSYLCGNDTMRQNVTVNGSTVNASSNNVLCNGQCTGLAVATVNGGSAPYTYLWNNGQSTSVNSNLCQGNYTVVVTDSSGCSATQTISISQPPVIATSINSTLPVSCNSSNGTANAVSTGGTPGYAYQWSNGQTTSMATGLSAGCYTVTVTDVNNCMNIDSVAIKPVLAVSIELNNTSCNGFNDGSAIVNPIDGKAPYTYLWSNGETLQSIFGLNAASYTIIVTDSNGCSNTTVFEVNNSTAEGIYLPNAFSPNGDGENDVFCLPRGVEFCIKNINIIIYDRWGEKIYESTDPKFYWDGSCKVKGVSAEVFVYLLSITFLDEIQINRIGNVSLVR